MFGEMDGIVNRFMAAIQPFTDRAEQREYEKDRDAEYIPVKTCYHCRKKAERGLTDEKGFMCFDCVDYFTNLDPCDRSEGC